MALSCVCPVLLTIGKGTHALEACPLDKLDEFLKVLLRLAGEAHHEGGAKFDAEFLNVSSLERLRLLILPTCVRFRYGLL